MLTDEELRKRIGARLLTERVQVKNWNESEAARASGIAPKTIRRIERGLNHEVVSIEKYCAALGKTYAAWLSEILLVGMETPRSEAKDQQHRSHGAGAAGRSFRN